MKVSEFLDLLKQHPEKISFNDTIETIEENYTFSPAAFSNGNTQNAANENNGSCKIFFFAQLNKLPEDLTLHCFGDYYRIDVLQNPDADDHQNIRNFMQSGWTGIHFSSVALSKK